MQSIDRMLKEDHREIDYELKKMVIKGGSDSLIESFLQVLRNCRRFRELVSNQMYFEFLQANFKGQKALQPIVAFFNFIYSSYTTEGEASCEEFSKLVELIRKAHPEVKDPQKVNDIEVILLAISSSFRYLSYLMENKRGNMRTFEETLNDLISLEYEALARLPTLSKLVDVLYEDLRKAEPKLMEVEGVQGKLRALKDNQQLVMMLAHKKEKALHLFTEMNILITQSNYNDEESALLNELIKTFSKKLLDLFGDAYINPAVIGPLQLDLLRDECRMNRYDLQNQVNFGYINVKFQYLSFTKTISCNLMGYMVGGQHGGGQAAGGNAAAKKEEADVQSLHSRITYTSKLTISTQDFRQKTETLRLPKIKNYLLKIMEIDPDMDIINDYDVIAYFQAKDKVSKANYYKFVSIEDRITAVMSDDIGTSFNVVFLNEKRLCIPNALKVFYSTKFTKGTILTDPQALLYVSLDNDEHLVYFVEHILKAHQLAEGSREDAKSMVDKIVNKLIFYLPSTVENEDDILKWKKWSKELQANKQTPLSDIYNALVEKSGYDIANYNGAHLYLSVYLDSESADLPLNTKQFDRNGFDKLDKKKSEMVQLNTGLTDIFDYVLTNYKTTLEGDEAKNPKDENAIWRFFENYPASMLLPTYLIVNVFDIRKLLELGDDLDFDYIENKINEAHDPISKRYNIVAIICQKKKAKMQDPTFYYPCIRIPDSKKLDSKIFKGYLGGDKEPVAPIYKFDREMVHFIIFEREIIQFL